jgi:hypothetical protein
VSMKVCSCRVTRVISSSACLRSVASCPTPITSHYVAAYVPKVMLADANRHDLHMAEGMVESLHRRRCSRRWYRR